ncbi:MAG: beta-agarase [Rhodopirellula sp. JB055]|uniref:beta-agarase n=1 Tax=Rhodopirellula sp. JB055 TaxID=3342846 RepID=UPI003709D63D
MKTIFLSAILGTLLPNCLFAQSPDQSLLSDEGVARRAAHTFLFEEFSKGKETTYRGEGDQRNLFEMVLSNETIHLSGDVSIELPEGSQRVVSLFKYIILRGENLNYLGGIDVAPYSGGGTVERSTQQPNLYRFKLPAMPVPSEGMPPIQIRTRCAEGKTATVTQIAFNSQGKLPVKFDDIPYRTLGADQPRVPVSVRVDLQHELSIAGHVDLEREKFFRYYAAPGTCDPSFERWANKRNFKPGRQIFKLQPGLVVGYGRGEKLRENPNETGAADLSFFERHDSSAPKTIPAFENVDYAMCLNDFPEFMSVEHVGRGTPLIEHFGDAADLAAAHIADQKADGGRTAKWWEVKNESTIKAEWDYHYQKEHDSWELLAQFHNEVAQAVHAKTASVNVGGPTSAWMQLHVNQFGLYRDQARFMDLTRNHLDFYSHHFYENMGSLGAWERRDNGYSGYLLGRLEATLDMLQAHMEETDNVKPILITECGSLQAGRGAADYWLRLRSYSAFVHKLMNRPHQIDLAVPFVFTNMHWNPKSGNVAFIPTEGASARGPLSDFQPTPVANYFELWRDFDGRRLPVETSGLAAVGLNATAVYQGNRLQIALTNMTSRQLSVDLSEITGDSLNASSIQQRRLRYNGGQVIYEDSNSLSESKTIPVDAEETTVVTLLFDKQIDPAKTLHREFAYAAGTAVTADQSRVFQIEIDDASKIDSAKLVIGVHRNNGLGEAIAGTFNGQSFESHPEWAHQFDQLMAPLAISISKDWLQKNNQIEIKPQPVLTITSVHLIHDRSQPLND